MKLSGVLEGIEQILVSSLDADVRIEWDTLVDHTPFPVPPPAKPAPLPPEPKWHVPPPEPKPSDHEFQITPKWHHTFFPPLRRRAERLAHKRFQIVKYDWHRLVSVVDAKNKALEEQHNLTAQRWQDAVTEHNRAMEEWTNKKTLHEHSQAEHNDHTQNAKKAYYDGLPFAIIEYCDMVLSTSTYPDNFRRNGIWNTCKKQRHLRSTTSCHPQTMCQTSRKLSMCRLGMSWRKPTCQSQLSTNCMIVFSTR